MGTTSRRVRLAAIGVRTLQLLVLIATGIVSLAALTLPISSRPVRADLAQGMVAPVTLQAPRDIEYVSELRTEEARLAAERSVSPVYSSPDADIAREQIERLSTTLQIITTIRDGPAMDDAAKREAMEALSDIRLQPETIDIVLGISPTRWTTIED